LLNTNESLYQLKRIVNMTRNFWFSILAAAILSSVVYAALGFQGAKEIALRDYYFAEGDQHKRLMHVFRPVGAALDAPADYWCQYLTKTDSGLVLLSYYYDKDQNMRQLGAERITKSGVLQESLTLFEKDSTGRLTQTKVEIKSAAMFPFAVLDTNTMVVYEIRYALPGSTGTHVRIQRNRRYAGAGPDFVFRGKTYPTIKMRLAEEVTSEGEGNATIKGEGEEWFAKGLGRVYYRKSYGSGQVSEAYELVDMLDCTAQNKACFE
jgi:hypothetical protein